MKAFVLILAMTLSIGWAQQDTTKDGRVVISSEKPKDPYAPKTLLKDKLRHGFFVALETGYGRAENEDAMLAGLRAGWIINHRFSLGLAGFSTVTNLRGNWQTPTADSAEYSGIGYGGFTLEPILFPESMVHVSFPVLIGAGAAWYSKQGPHDPDDFPTPQDRRNHTFGRTQSYPFFVIEPAVNVEMNVTKFFRAGIFGKYRLVSSMEENSYFTNSGLSDFTVGLTLKFGKF